MSKSISINNIEILGLSDFKGIDSFDSTKAWTYNTVYDVLVIPSSKPSICKILKVFNQCNIDTVDIINTCSSDICNLNGNKLTGKKLIIQGYVSQNYIYSPINDLNALQYHKFKIPFCCSLILDDFFCDIIDTYCVTPYIEDVYINSFSKRFIYTSVTLYFLVDNNN